MALQGQRPHGAEWTQRDDVNLLDMEACANRSMQISSSSQYERRQTAGTTASFDTTQFDSDAAVVPIGHCDADVHKIA